MNNNEQNAKIFIEAIKTISEKPDNLDNLETYLSYHFDEWLKKFADTPDKLAGGIKTIRRNGNILKQIPGAIRVY